VQPNPDAHVERQVLMIDRLRQNWLPDDSEGPPSANDVVEIPLLLPGWQMDALESAAHDRGLTAAEMVRQLLRSFILELPRTMGCTPRPAGRTEAALERPAV
jgi:hypothetical protein